MANTTSAHFDEFKLRVDTLRRERGDIEAAWEAIVDVGQQVSFVRHDLANVKMANETRDFRLFGDEIKGQKVPGKFDEIEARFDRVETLITLTAADQKQEVQQRAAELKHQHDERQRWWQTFWGRIGIVCGAAYALAQTVALLYTTVHH